MNPLPFETTDGLFNGAFGSDLTSISTSVFNALSAPLAACVVLWIIVQGLLVMRGDLDTRRGVIRTLRVVIVYSLVASAANYASIVGGWFQHAVPYWIAEVTTGQTTYGSIPATLDFILATTRAEFQVVSGQINPADSTDSGAFQNSQFIFYATLWTIFVLYEIAGIMTSVLIALGPLFLIGYLFDSTRQIAERWVGQLINYAVLLLLVFVVATIVLNVEYGYVQLYMIATMVLQPVSSALSDFYDLDIFLATGDFIVLSLPVVASFIGGGLNSSRGEGMMPGGGRGMSAGGATAGRATAGAGAGVVPGT